MVYFLLLLFIFTISRCKFHNKSVPLQRNFPIMVGDFPKKLELRIENLEPMVFQSETEKNYDYL